MASFPVCMALRSVLPTILDYFGMEAPEGIDSRSLRPVIGGRGEPAETYGFAERDASDRSWLMRMSRGDRWKYVYRTAAGPNELFDTENDPGENVNLFHKPEHKETVLEMHARLREWMERTGDPGLGLVKAPYEA